MTLQSPSGLAALETLLLAHGVVSAEALARARDVAQQGGVRLPAALTALGLITEHELAEVFAALLGLPVLAKQAVEADAEAAGALNLDFLRGRRVLPVRDADGARRLAMADPLDDEALEAMRFALGGEITPVIACASDIEDALEAAATGDAPNLPAALLHDEQGTDDLALLSDRDSEAPVIRMVSRLINKAVELRASDIHIEPQPAGVAVRFRVDGDLCEAELLPRRWGEPLATRLKLLARLDIAEKRLPQDGRIRTTSRGAALDLRLATFPSMHGESLTLRVLGRSHLTLDLDAIGLPAAGLAALRSALARPHGLILITGPTGSGKTTTLYAALNALKAPRVKLMTVEDPIEYTLPGVTQLQVKPEVGLSYAAALRAMLRNDPDIIMVGEIRDLETAEIAIRAALTGHLVLATLHTNTAAGALTRLLDLGVADYLLASTVALACAQRLVGTLCPACKTARAAKPDEIALLDGAGVAHHGTLFEAEGCPQCLGRGISGRTPLFEALPIDEAMRARIRSGFDEHAMQAATTGETLLSHGLALAAAGVVSLRDVLSVTGASA